MVIMLHLKVGAQGLLTRKEFHTFVAAPQFVNLLFFFCFVILLLVTHPI
jgi:hypothetical protein